MGVLVPTVGSVAWVSGPIAKDFNAGETFVQGDYVYLATTNLWMKILANGTAIQNGSGVRTGVALSPGTVGQPAFIQEGGVINMGCTLAIGTLYGASVTAGKIGPITDLVSTNKINVLGIALTAANLDMAYKQAYTGGCTGVSVP